MISGQQQDKEPTFRKLPITNPHDLLNLEHLRNAYEKALPPLIILAANQGFSPTGTMAENRTLIT